MWTAFGKEEYWNHNNDMEITMGEENPFLILIVQFF
jgi:hypothetical protein